MSEKWTYTWDNRFDENEYDQKRLLLFFGKHNVENVIYLGKIMYTEARHPIWEHSHQDAFEITYHITGNQVLFLDERKYEVGAGDILISFPGEIHKTSEYVEEVSSYYFFSFVCRPGEKSFLGLETDASRYLANGLYGIQNRQFKASAKLKYLLDEIIKTYETDNPICKARIQYLFAEAVYSIVQSSRSMENKDAIPQDIAEIMDYIDSRANENTSLSELASQSHLSIHQLKHRFKRYVGISPHNYLLRKKTQLAKDMLRYTNLPLIDIAFQLGFSSSQHFSMIFKKFEFLTPSQYRKSIQHK